MKGPPGPPIAGTPAATEPRDPPKGMTVSRQGDFTIQSGNATKAPLRVVIYGPGGVGKTKLVANASQAGLTPLILDIEGGVEDLEVDLIPKTQLPDFDSVLEAIASPICRDHDFLVIDSATALERLAIDDVLAKVPMGKDGGGKSQGIEGYGWGKGYRFLADRYDALLQALEVHHWNQGRGVGLICHEIKANVPNPAGEDFIRYELALFENRQVSIRQRVKNWASHVFFLNFDAAVTDNKAQGSGTRSIYTTELPHFWAKTRNSALASKRRLPYRDGDAELWKILVAG